MWGCFQPHVEDGAVACGEAGCPPGLACVEGVCRTPVEGGPGGGSPGEAGDVVLAIARHNATSEVRAYCDGGLEPAWEIAPGWSASTVAWGKSHGARPELVVGSSDDELRLFEIKGNALHQVAALDWLRQSRSTGWADYDGDGDLDLAISDGEHSLKVMRSRRDGLETLWHAEDMVEPWGLAWGDLDGDRLPDLAVASSTTVSVYRNIGEAFTRAWTRPGTEDTRSVAWADLDGDGDLDLVSGSLAGPVRAFTNQGGVLIESWASPQHGDVPALAFGDYDGDGDPDLAVAGRDQPSRVYRNDRGALVPAWATEASLTTWSVAWFDVDNDGDLDLTLGNHDQPSRILRNDDGRLVDWLTLDVGQVRELSWTRWPLDAGEASVCDNGRGW